jgi:enoyl-CoA hydratase/carnithine racemase
MNEVLRTNTEGRVLRLILNRPEKRNALSAELCRKLVEALETAGRDPAIGAIVLLANGKVFCAGMDVSEIGPSTTGAIAEANEQLFTVGARLPKPLIAAVEGVALGGGVGLLANCHIVVAGEQSTFGLTEIRLGLWPFLIYRAVAAALGERRTTELALTGRIFGPAEAREIDLVHEIAADAAGAAMERAQSMAAYSPTAIRRGLRFVEETRGRDWQTAGAIARRDREEIFQTADFKEGIRAFQEKRPPRWPSLEGT